MCCVDETVPFKVHNLCESSPVFNRQFNGSDAIIKWWWLIKRSLHIAESLWNSVDGRLIVKTMHHLNCIPKPQSHWFLPIYLAAAFLMFVWLSFWDLTTYRIERSKWVSQTLCARGRKVWGSLKSEIRLGFQIKDFKNLSEKEFSTSQEILAKSNNSPSITSQNRNLLVDHVVSETLSEFWVAFAESISNMWTAIVNGTKNQQCDGNMRLSFR